MQEINVELVKKSIVAEIVKTGATGPKGDTGNTGPAGPAGAAGTPGTPGTDGIDGVGVAPGGATGQLLAKASDDDFDTEWVANDAFDRANHTGTQSSATISDFDAASDARIAAAEGDSIASLVGGLVPTSQIPAVALTTVQVAASEAAMLALTTQAGDVVIRSDEHKSYMHNGGTAGTMADFTLVDTPSDAVTSVNGQTGTIVLGKADIGLPSADNTSDVNKPISSATQAALDAKQATITPGTTEQYYRGDKSWQTLDKSAVGLPNADNTSDADKPVSTAQAAAIGAKVDKAGSTMTGPLTFTAQGNPATPAADLLSIYNRKLAGRSMLHSITEAGIVNPMQPAIFGNFQTLIDTQNTTAFNTMGNGVTTVGTISHPAKTEARGFMGNVAITTPAASATCGTGNRDVLWCRGSSGLSNGFFFMGRVLFPDASYDQTGATTGSRIFVGLTAATMATVVAADTASTNTCGFSRRHTDTGAQDTNWQFLTRAGGSPTLADTGMPFVVDHVYDMYIYCKPLGTTVYWRIDDLTAGTSVEGNTSSTLPIATTLMRGGVQVWSADAVVRNCRLSRIYTESDV